LIRPETQALTARQLAGTPLRRAAGDRQGHRLFALLESHAAKPLRSAHGCFAAPFDSKARPANEDIAIDRLVLKADRVHDGTELLAELCRHTVDWTRVAPQDVNESSVKTLYLRASAEVVAAIAYASAHHTKWLWDGVGG
jgi:hypothetical protein